MSCNTEHDNSKGRCKATKCAVTSSETERNGMFYVPKRATLGSYGCR